MVATLTIRGLDADTKARLRVSAAQNGRSMEAEARAILKDALPSGPPSGGLGSRIRARFTALGGEELDLPPRGDMPRAIDLQA